MNTYGLLAAIIIFLVALVDDRKNISPSTRLLAQILAVCLVVFGGHIYISWDIAAWIWPWLGLVILMWAINLYNFMDGMDGFAGAMAVIGFGALSVLALVQNQLAFAFFCWLLVAASLGFICLNFPPARIFMGDSGSTVMGFMMGIISIAGWKRELYALWVPLVIFSPFWVDASLTLIRRLIRGERIWEAHRQHFYQQCVLAGLSHRRVLGGYIVLMVLCSLSAICGQVFLEGYNAAIVSACWLVFYLLVASTSKRIITLLKAVP
jgi:UDP-N-acetylmuramyl pentapeptide phosphotransferase/UDP-N-acetylglucosamine-1-phosphate transferase